MKNKNKLEKLSKATIDDINVLYDNILVKSLIITEKNGVIVPQTYETKPEAGEVVAVGEGRLFDDGDIQPLKVKVGDIVLFNKYLSTKHNLSGQDYYLIREEDVIAYIR